MSDACFVFHFISDVQI